MKDSDVIVVGDGVIGLAVACGLLQLGLRVSLFGGGGHTLRASLGNFGLVWVQGKGRGARHYAEWCRLTADRFPEFERWIYDETGIDISYRKPGGLTLCHSEQEYEKRSVILELLSRESRDGYYDGEMIGREAAQKVVGDKIKLGPKIVGASYSPHDGYLNPLALLRALLIYFRQNGGDYHPDTPVNLIEPDSSRFRVSTRLGRFSSAKLVVAAGLATKHLAGMVGIDAPVIPERGQLMVTERVQPILSVPISGIQQTVEGSFIVGLSNEKIGINTETNFSVIKCMADRVRSALPALGKLQVVRSWAALRVLSPDGMPIYQQSQTSPGAYAVTSHSGVSLAPLHLTEISRWIMDGTSPAEFDKFSSGRFDAKKTA